MKIPFFGELRGMGSFLFLVILGFMLMTGPRISRFGALSPPAQRQICQLIQAGIIVNRVMKA
jgi:hypothetical protein